MLQTIQSNSELSHDAFPYRPSALGRTLSRLCHSRAFAYAAVPFGISAIS